MKENINNDYLFSQDKHICAICSQKSGGCCKVDPKEVANCFPLSEAELERLLPFAHLVDDSFGKNTLTDAQKISVSETNTKNFLDLLKKLFPYGVTFANRFPLNSTHLRLRTKEDGSCIFLDDSGCRLPKNVRPWYCLLFPSWIHGGSLSFFTADCCLIANSVNSVPEGLSLIGIKAKEVRTLYACLLKDWNIS